MSSTPTRLALVSAVTVAMLTGTANAETSLDARVARLERILQNQSGSELLLQVQQLQTEMQELRGMLEKQRLDIDRLQRQQRDQYLDIDSRLGTARPGTAGLSAQTAGTVSGAPADAQQVPLPQGVIDASGGQLQAAPGDEAQPATAPADQPPAQPEAPSSTLPAPSANGIPSLPAPETLGGSERDAYTSAFALLKERKYDEAKAAFGSLLQSYPQGEYADSARYWLAETCYVQRDYATALTEFGQLVQLHPRSPKVPGALLKIGYIQFDQKAYGPARETLSRVISSYPNSTEARLARSRIDRIPQSAR